MRNKHLIASAASAALLALAGPASANTAPTGVWIDHTGRGGVEITECGPNLCGRLVWLKDTKNKSACGTQILGNVKPMGSGVWDKGWIYDPEERAKYDVELKPMGADKLRVVGYMGSKFLSETMIWKRAPADLQRCGAEPVKAAAEPAKSTASEPAKSAAAEPSPAPASGPREAIPAPIAKTPADPAPASPPPAVKSATAEHAESAPAADEPEPKPRKSGKQRTAKRECRLDLPYIKVTYPCID